MNLLVGSTGLLGGMIARKLRARGAPLRVMVRRSSDYASLQRDGAEIVFGDLKDPSSLEAACRGVKSVITTANAAQRGGEDTIASVDLAGNRALIDAAKKAGVAHFVFVSAAGVDEKSPVPLFVAKAKAEAHLRDSGVPWTILAPHAFMEVWFPTIIGSALAAGKPVALIGGGKMRRSWVAVDDVASLATAAVGNPTAVRQRIILGGPEALSWSDLVAETSRIIGRELPVQSLQPGQPIPTLPPPADQFIGFLLAGLEQQDDVVDSTSTARMYGISLTPARTVLKRLFGSGA